MDSKTNNKRKASQEQKVKVTAAVEHAKRKAGEISAGINCFAKRATRSPSRRYNLLPPSERLIIGRLVGSKNLDGSKKTVSQIAQLYGASLSSVGKWSRKQKDKGIFRKIGRPVYLDLISLEKLYHLNKSHFNANESLENEKDRDIYRKELHENIIREYQNTETRRAAYEKRLSAPVQVSRRTFYRHVEHFAYPRNGRCYKLTK